MLTEKKENHKKKVDCKEEKKENNLPVYSSGIWTDNNGVNEIHVTEIRHTHRAAV